MSSRNGVSKCSLYTLNVGPLADGSSSFNPSSTENKCDTPDKFVRLTGIYSGFSQNYSLLQLMFLFLHLNKLYEVNIQTTGWIAVSYFWVYSLQPKLVNLSLHPTVKTRFCNVNSVHTPYLNVLCFSTLGLVVQN